jgi:putative ABC transport system permease protein
MLHAIRVATRSIRHRPIVALAVIATLTLAIGANTAIFSAVDAVLLKPLPYPDGDRLVLVFELNRGMRQAIQLVAPGRLEEWHAQNRSFVGIAGSYFENMTDTTGALPERVGGMRVSPRFFAVMGVRAALGRTFTNEEEYFGGPRAIVISDAFWRRRLNADPSAIGRALTIGGSSRTIVGVMPPSFLYPTTTTDAWIPTQADGTPIMQARRARFMTAVARMKPGVTLAQAEQDLSEVQARLGEQFPETDKGWAASVVSLKEQRVGGVRRSLWLLFGAVGFLLLAACGNIACLMLAEAARREHEVAVRFAIGASRWTVVRQLLLEGLVLAIGGAACGLVLAIWGTALLRRTATGLPRIEEVQVSLPLVAFTLALGVLTTMVFALVPALQATRLAPVAALAQGGRSTTGGRHTLRRVLVAAQVALAIVLLAGSGLLIRSFAELRTIPLGFEPADVWTFRMSAQWNEQFEAVVTRQARTIERLEAVPGVEAAGFSQLLPGGLDIPPSEFGIVGRDSGAKTFSLARSVSAGYFATLHIPILQGETCSADPSTTFASEVLVTRAFADQYFAGENAVGHSLMSPGLPPGTSTRIRGVVGDVREGGAKTSMQPLIYYCGYNPYWPDPFFLVRASRDRGAVMDAIRAAMLEIEPNRALYSVQRLEDTLAESLTQHRLSAILLALFAATAVLLAAVGLYGVLAQLVSSRRREIGVRMAIGARPAQIVRSVIAQAATMTGAGLVVGLAGALALAQFMTSLVFGISPRDPVTFALVPFVLAIVAGLAAFIPARRAASIDPMKALREE